MLLKIKKPKISILKAFNQKEIYYWQKKTKYNWNIVTYLWKDSQKISLSTIETLIQEFWLNLIKTLFCLPEDTLRTYHPKEKNPKNLLKSKNHIINPYLYKLNILKEGNPCSKINKFSPITVKESLSCSISWNLTQPKIFLTKTTSKSEGSINRKGPNLEASLRKFIIKTPVSTLIRLKNSSGKWT